LASLAGGAPLWLVAVPRWSDLPSFPFRDNNWADFCSEPGHLDAPDGQHRPKPARLAASHPDLCDHRLDRDCRLWPAAKRPGRLPRAWAPVAWSDRSASTPAGFLMSLPATSWRLVRWTGWPWQSLSLSCQPFYLGPFGLYFRKIGWIREGDLKLG